MSTTAKACHHQRWSDLQLQEFGDFSERVEYVNQEDDYGDSLCGEWYYIDDERHIIYCGTFGNDHSPGADYCTFAEIFDMEDVEDSAAFEAAKKQWESYPEFSENREAIEQ